MLVVAAITVFVFVVLDHAMNAEVDTDTDEKHRTDMPEPFFEGTHLLRQVPDADGAVAY